MPVVHSSGAPIFTYTMPGVEPKPAIPHVTVRGLAAPSRGATETCVWRLTLAPGAPPRLGMVDREEVFVLLSGSAAVTLDGEQHHLNVGDALIVPPNTTFGIGNPYDEPLEMMTVLPVGGRGIVPGQEPFVPPWAE